MNLKPIDERAGEPAERIGLNRAGRYIPECMIARIECVPEENLRLPPVLVIFGYESWLGLPDFPLSGFHIPFAIPRESGTVHYA